MPTLHTPHSVPRRRLLAASALLATVACGCSTTATHAPQPAPRVEHRLRGSGRPVIVLQSGLGDGLSVWQDVQSSLPATLTSVAFSRPGYGRSAWVEGGRSPCDVAQMTREFLRGAGLWPPYVLVGHSLGGLYQVAFALRHPDEVAGLVLLDPTHPAHWAALQREVPVMAAVVKAARTTSFSAPMRREFDDQARCLDDLERLRPRARPVRLLVRERFIGLEAGAFERMVRRLEADWANRLGVVEPERVPGTGHYLQRDRPQAVAEAIGAVAALAAAGATAEPPARRQWSTPPSPTPRPTA